MRRLDSIHLLNAACTFTPISPVQSLLMSLSRAIDVTEGRSHSGLRECTKECKASAAHNLPEQLPRLARSDFGESWSLGTGAPRGEHCRFRKTAFMPLFQSLAQAVRGLRRRPCARSLWQTVQAHVIFLQIFTLCATPSQPLDSTDLLGGPLHCTTLALCIFLRRKARRREGDK